jgi:pimeloyl-ACP methyl ester carboxylesterase
MIDQDLHAAAFPMLDKAQLAALEGCPLSKREHYRDGKKLFEAGQCDSEGPGLICRMSNGPRRANHTGRPGPCDPKGGGLCMPEEMLGHVASADGTRLALWREGSGPPLVAVHGTTADHTRWLRVAPRLASRFTVYLMDRRGRGRSGDAASYSLRHEAEDIRAVVRHAGKGVTLVGHSYGGLCSMEAALDLPELHRLILYEPPLPVGSGMVPQAVRVELERLVESGDREGALLYFYREVVGAPEAELESLKAQPIWTARIAAAHTIAREANEEERYGLDLGRLGALRVPTLLLLGGESPATFVEATALLHDAIPNSRVHELEGQRHIAMDTAPEQFVDAIISFALDDD